MVNAKNKGAAGEREVAELLQPTVTKAYTETLGITEAEVPRLRRNVLQVQEGGYDLVGLDWLALEVKRVEALGKGGILKGHVRQWWLQCLTAAQNGKLVGGNEGARYGGANGLAREPVLMYRPNGWTWTIRMYGYLSVGPNGGVRVKAPITCELEPFLIWLDQRIRWELRGMGLAAVEKSVDRPTRVILDSQKAGPCVFSGEKNLWFDN